MPNLSQPTAPGDPNRCGCIAVYSEFVSPSEITADRLHTDSMRNPLVNAMQLCLAGAETDSRLGLAPMANAVAA